MTSVTAEALQEEFLYGQAMRQLMCSGVVDFYRQQADLGLFADGPVVLGCYDERLMSFAGLGWAGMGVGAGSYTRMALHNARRAGVVVESLTYHEDCAVLPDLFRARTYCANLQYELANDGYEGVGLDEIYIAEGRPLGRHDAIGVVLDPTGRLDRRYIPERMFGQTWNFLPVNYLRQNLGLAHGIAIGEHGYEGLFDDDHPFWVDFLLPSETSGIVRKTIPSLRRFVDRLPYARLTFIEL